MNLQDQIFVQYLLFLFESETDKDIRREKAIKALDYWFLQKDWKAENERLRGVLGDAREETLWNAYRTGHVKNGLWSHLFMSDGEWLAQECGFDPTEYEYPDDEIRAAIPKVARAALKENTDATSD